MLVSTGHSISLIFLKYIYIYKRITYVSYIYSITFPTSKEFLKEI